MSFGDNSAMLHNDAAQATSVLTQVLSSQEQVQIKQQQLTTIALSLLVAAVVIRIALK